MSILNIIFDKIFIINLDDRKDRWRGMELELKKFGILNYERFSAIRPEFGKLSPTCYNRMNAEESHNHAYLNNASGCKLSHVEILRTSNNRGYKSILILEDDARFMENLDKTLSSASRELDGISWDMLYLGWDHLRNPGDFSPHWKTFSQVYTTHAYAVSNGVWNYMIENAVDSGYEIDVFYSKKIHPQYHCLSLHPEMVYQITGYSDILGRQVDQYKTGGILFD